MAEIDDERLAKIAAKRLAFRKSLYSYVAVNSLLWLIWWVTTGRITGFTGYPWPVWLMLGWGMGIIIQYFQSYRA